MISLIPDYRAATLEACPPDAHARNADYIPELARVDSSLFALAIATVDGMIYSAGDLSLIHI